MSTRKSSDQTTEGVKKETAEFEEESVGDEVTKEPRTSSRIRKATFRYGYDDYAETASPVPPARKSLTMCRMIEEPLSMSEAKETNARKNGWLLLMNTIPEDFVRN